MRVSLNTVKQFTAVDLPKDELIAKINAQLGGVENVIDLGARYDGAVIVRVVSCEKHPNADKLNICHVDDGSGEMTQVVCGAPNVRADMLAVWLKPGAIVPSTADDKEPFVLGARELRGVMSNGMLASPKELGLGDSHDGILELDADEWKPTAVAVAPGVSFASAYGLDDTIVEIENKMFTHRPDLFGQLGVAREIAGIQNERFVSPDWYFSASVDAPDGAPDMLPLEVFNEAGDNAPRFMAVVVKDIVIKQSPLWLQCALVAMGGKPINNVVDATNYIMLLTAQPTHAYDYDKIRGATIGARMAQPGETVRLLNGKSYTLEASDIVIADGKGPVGLAGIMGGGDSEVTDTTTNLVLEVANFDMYTLRKSSMRHGVFTDALARFNKGQSPYQNPAVLAKLTDLIHMVAGGSDASAVFDEGEGFDRGYADTKHGDVGAVTSEFINARLGTDLSDEQIAELLRNVEFDVQIDETGIDYRAPYWRTDIEQAEDIVEEVGRLHGFDKLPRVLPMKSSKPAPKNARLQLKQTVRDRLSGLGANEVLTYSFVSEKMLAMAGQNPEHAFKLSNALSPELQHYRLSLTPSLLEKIRPNKRAGYDEFALFEIGKTHFKGEFDAEDQNVPNEDEQLAFVITRADTSNGAAYYAARRYFDAIADTAGYSLVTLSEVKGDDEWGVQLTAAYEPERSVALVKDDQVWGVVGEFTEVAKKAFKLSDQTAGFEIHLDALMLPEVGYRPLSRFPSTSQDVSLRVPLSTDYRSLRTVAEAVLNELDPSFVNALGTISIYSGDGSTDKTITFRVSLVNDERTLTDNDMNMVIAAIAERAAAAHGAVLV